MIIAFMFSFMRELVGTVNQNLYLNKHDVIASFTSALKCLIAIVGDAFVLGIPISRTLLIKALCGSMAVLSASLLAIPVSKKLNIVKDEIYEFTIYFYKSSICTEVKSVLDSMNISCYYNQNKTKKLVVTTHNKQESKILLETINNKCKFYKAKPLTQIYLD